MVCCLQLSLSRLYPVLSLVKHVRSGDSTLFSLACKRAFPGRTVSITLCLGRFRAGNCSIACNCIFCGFACSKLHLLDTKKRIFGAPKGHESPKVTLEQFRRGKGRSGATIGKAFVLEFQVGYGHDMARYSQIWPDMARYGQIWLDLARYGQIWLNVARYELIWPDITRYC